MAEPTDALWLEQTEPVKTPLGALIDVVNTGPDTSLGEGALLILRMLEDADPRVAEVWLDPDSRASLARVLAGGRLSGDRRLPPPYDTLPAADRETWLILEAVYDAALTDEVRRHNAGRTMAPWAQLVPEAQQALSTALLQVVRMVHAVALNPQALAPEQPAPRPRPRTPVSPNCAARTRPHEPHTLAGPGGNKPGEPCGGVAEVCTCDPESDQGCKMAGCPRCASNALALECPNSGA